MNASLFTQNSLLGPSPAMLVGGQWITSTATRPVDNPATGEVFTAVPDGQLEHVEQALTKAKAAQKEWGQRSLAERARVLEEVVRQVDAHAEELAQIVVAEQGKTITEARGEIGGVKAFFDYAISQKYRNVGELVAPSAHGEQLSIREEPVGIVAAIIPWNFPAAIFARKVAPALMAGNAIVVKPSDLTPLSSLAMAKICELAGVPEGLVSVITGPGRILGAALVEHPLVNMVTVTGSTRAGQEILAKASEKVIPVSLELGGKAPVIVFDDANLDLAVQKAFEARFWNCGQVCTCNERTYVQRGVYEEFVSRFVAKVKSLRVGDPLDEASEMGPKVSRAERDKIIDFVDAAVAAGAKIEIGGGAPDGLENSAGYWVAPTVLTNVTNDMDIVQQEVFGPVLPIVPFDTYDEAIEWANSTVYGLTAYVFTENIRTAMSATDDLEFGEVYLNKIGPEQVQGFHTGWKLSGLGGDDGQHGFERYSRRKTVYLDYSATK
ncbi:aldehyde dehydrogenase family protein [Paenarthrobacter sp. OM7]|uniref:Aldehyde dehydrogenase family protein n=1 Tax=Paenarthrobacter sp. AMU7 TaxID=3162492 RepID=A0AB39YR92_9MICC|nr:aldehyde dehydrogenase family protein [Paenarthrobacter sp. OM7]WGM20499.1 aldehyde dehydrogenase family protein [Paenarthrobacter sp. OM7]